MEILWISGLATAVVMIGMSYLRYGEGGDCGCSVGSNWNSCQGCSVGGTSCTPTEAGCGFLGWYKCDGRCGQNEL
jgi:hypothetical protein